MHKRASPAHGRPLSYGDHNQTVPADAGLDACRCPACLGENRGPAAILRGPIQCESRTLDPLDALALDEIEGRVRR